MLNTMDVLPRLLAFREGRAVRIASNQRVAIRRDRLVICPIAMAGEDTSIHTVACGRVGQVAEFRCVPDPRYRDDQYGLFEWLGDRVEQYFLECQQAGSYPQIWVPSSGAVGLLDTLADRLRFNQENLRVKRFGELLSYATERFPIEGQQALMTATGALKMHFATGQQEGEDEHLGTLLVWMRPPSGRNVLAVVAAAEEVPMGVKTDPDFDRDDLEPLVSAYNEARKRKATSKELETRAKQIEDQLRPVVSAIYDGTQEAISLLVAEGLQPLPHLDGLEAREADEFRSFMFSRESGHFLPLRDSPKSAAFRLAAREDAAEGARAALLYGDRVHLERERLAGRILRGTVENPVRTRLAPRRFECRFTVVTGQRVLHVRRRDELHLLADPRMKVVVTDVRRSGRTTRVSVVMLKGARAVGLPAANQEVAFGDGPPDWNRIILLRKQMRDRLATQPWTHQDGQLPGASPSNAPRPADLLAAIEGLR
jgi:hypothetical protein